MGITDQNHPIFGHEISRFFFDLFSPSLIYDYLLLYGSVSQGLGTTKSANLIG